MFGDKHKKSKGKQSGNAEYDDKSVLEEEAMDEEQVDRNGGHRTERAAGDEANPAIIRAIADLKSMVSEVKTELSDF